MLGLYAYQAFFVRFRTYFHIKYRIVRIRRCSILLFIHAVCWRRQRKRLPRATRILSKRMAIQTACRSISLALLKLIGQVALAGHW